MSFSPGNLIKFIPPIDSGLFLKRYNNKEFTVIRSFDSDDIVECIRGNMRYGLTIPTSDCVLVESKPKFLIGSVVRVTKDINFYIKISQIGVVEGSNRLGSIVRFAADSGEHYSYYVANRNLW